jgi:hypothetical protein
MFLALARAFQRAKAFLHPPRQFTNLACEGFSAALRCGLTCASGHGRLQREIYAEANTRNTPAFCATCSLVVRLRS